MEQIPTAESAQETSMKKQLEQAEIEAYIANVREEYEKNHRLYEALDKVVEKAKVEHKMSDKDALRFRNLLSDKFNDERRAQFNARRGRTMLAGGKYSGRDLAAGAEAEERNEQVALEFNPKSSENNKGAA